MQRLGGAKVEGEGRMSKSYAMAMGHSQDAKLRHVYATTPQKRKRIFE